MVMYPYVSPLAFERLTTLTQAIKYSLAENLVRIINPRFVPAFDRDAIRVSLLGLYYERVFAAIPVDNPFSRALIEDAKERVTALNEQYIGELEKGDKRAWLEGDWGDESRIEPDQGF